MALGRRELGAILLGVAAIMFYLVLLSTTPSGAQTGGGTTGTTTNQNGNADEGCDNPEEVATFDRTENQITPDFEITGDTFRLTYEATVIDPDEFASFTADAVGEDGFPVDFIPLTFDDASDSVNVLEGPGTFNLEIESTNFEYIIIVEDCVGDDTQPTTTQRTTRDRTTNNNANRGGRTVINVPNKPLPPTGGLPVAAVVASSVLAGAGLLALGFVIRRGPRG